jgi:ATP-binding cassette subfamily C protein
LDPVSETAICETVHKLRGTTTILAVTHQPAMLDVADRVYRLEHGAVQQMMPQQAVTKTTSRVA